MKPKSSMSTWQQCPPSIDRQRKWYEDNVPVAGKRHQRNTPVQITRDSSDLRSSEKRPLLRICTRAREGNCSLPEHHWTWMRNFQSGRFHENMAMFQPDEAGKDVMQPLYKPASPPESTFTWARLLLLPCCPVSGWKATPRIVLSSHLLIEY